MIQYICPSCNLWSGDTFKVIKTGENGLWQQEWIRCDCGWEGQWKDIVEFATETYYI